MTDRFVISGTGIVSPIGNGNDAVWGAAERGHTGIRRLTKFKFGDEIMCGEVKDFDLGNYLTDRRFRRAAPISQYALAAASMALGDASDNENSSLIMGITHGALGYTQAFHKELLKNGPESVSPIYFSDSVLNAPAGNVSLCFGIKGPVHTILGGAESVIKSMIMACGMLDDDETDKTVVVSAEELNELSLFCYDRLGFKSISEGAAAIVIKKEKNMSGSESGCFISALASQCNPADPASALDGAIQGCMLKSGLETTDIDLIFANGAFEIAPGFSRVPVCSLARIAGNAFAAGLLWEIVFSAMALQRGRVPGAVIRSGKLSSKVNNIMICTADKYGNSAAAILSKR